MMNIQRRTLLRGLAVLGTGMALGVRSIVPRDADAATLPRFDLHHHYCSPEWVAVLDKQPGRDPGGMKGFHDWKPTAAMAAMDEAGVRTAVLSTTTPGIWFGNDQQAKTLARNMNDFGANLVRTYKGRYGLFAVLPLPNVSNSLAEITYAFDTLRADGISVLSSYGDKWLGHPSFSPMWAELDRRKAIVFSHATAPSCCAGTLVPNLQATTIEFNTDTARTIVDLIESGTAEKYPNIRFIFSHAGGTIPSLAGRYLSRQSSAQALKGTAAPNSRLDHLRRFYYDTAGSANPVQMRSLSMIVPPSQILYGTDFPWGTPARIVEGLGECGFSDAELAGIEHDNALRLLPQLRA